MSEPKKSTIDVRGTAITVLSQTYEDAIEFLGIWEQLNIPGFNPIEFDGFRKQVGLSSFALKARLNNPRLNPVEFDGIGIRTADGAKRPTPTAMPARGSNYGEFATIGNRDESQRSPRKDGRPWI